MVPVANSNSVIIQSPLSEYFGGFARKLVVFKLENSKRSWRHCWTQSKPAGSKDSLLYKPGGLLTLTFAFGGEPYAAETPLVRIMKIDVIKSFDKIALLQTLVVSLCNSLFVLVSFT